MNNKAERLRELFSNSVFDIDNGALLTSANVGESDIEVTETDYSGEVYEYFFTTDDLENATVEADGHGISIYDNVSESNVTVRFFELNPVTI